MNHRAMARRVWIILINQRTLGPSSVTNRRQSVVGACVIGTHQESSISVPSDIISQPWKAAHTQAGDITVAQAGRVRRAIRHVLRLARLVLGGSG